jgi:hypothetical protein
MCLRCNTERAAFVWLQALELRGWSEKAGDYISKNVSTGGLRLRGFERTPE